MRKGSKRAAGTQFLNDAMIRAAKPKEKEYTLSDGGGLQVLVNPRGQKYFQFRYTYGGRKRKLQVGVYGDIPLAKARQDVDQFKEWLHEGRDPLIARKVALNQKVADTLGVFANVAAKWLATKRPEWTPLNYRRQEGVLNRWLLPALGAMPVKDITSDHIFEALQKPQDRGLHASVHEARMTVHAIFRFAMARRYVTTNPATDIVDGLTKRPPVVHHAALPFEQVGEMLRRLADSGLSPITRAAIRLSAMLGLRDGTLRSATWSEIDLNGAQWDCPAEHMKGRKARKKPYSTPLPRQAVRVLKDLHKLTYKGPDSHVFPGTGKHPMMSKSTQCSGLHQLGFQVTQHGFRALMRTHLGECGVPAEVVKIQLAQVVGSAVDQAYQRSRFWEQRVQMLQYWADLLESQEKGKKAPRLVTNVTFKRAA